MPQSRSSLRRTLVIMTMLILMVSGQALALMHRVAHVKDVEQATNIVCAPIEYACASALSSGAQASDDWLFGHERGVGCLDFDAALGIDSSIPTAALAYALPECITAECFTYLVSPLVRLQRFSLARAPPRS
jgi:hypothetical protein